MKTKTFAGITAAVMLCACLSAGNKVYDTHAAEGYDVDVTVDLSGGRKEISSLIYGVNDAGYLDDASFTAIRQGGNRYTAYNWESNYSNSGSDYKHINSPQLPKNYEDELADVPGACAVGLSRDAAANGVDYKVATLQLAGYVSADGNGEVTEAETAPSSRWKEVRASKGSVFSLTPDTSDDYVYMDEYVNYLVRTLGDSTAASGIQAYELDNEVGLWSETHPRLHPEASLCEEIISKNIEYASAVKKVDPDAEIYGAVLYGYGTYLSLKEASDWKETYSSEYDWFVSCYLDNMAKAEEEYGRRLIDVIDLHYYTDVKGTGDCRVANCMDNTHTECIENRMQAVRSLYDESYVEDTWIGQWYSDHLPVLPNIRESIETYYPGTKHAISEYNFGGGDHISGAIAEADALGIFASNDVYMAALWPLSSYIDYQLSAIDLYRNYDGRGSSFGDTLVASDTSDTERSTSYAAIHGDDESTVTLVVTNKSLTETQNTTITLNSDTAYKSAAVYGLTGESSDIQLMQVVSGIENNTFTIELPALSVVQIEISADEFVLIGDADTDGDADNADAVLLQKYISGVSDTAASLKNSDMNGDGTVNIFDLCILKSELAAADVPDVIDVPFEPGSAVGKWKLPDGLEGKTLTCTFTGSGGYHATIGFGYWDASLNDGYGAWVQDDTTTIGTVKFNSSGEGEILFTVPDGAASVQLQVYYYAVYSASVGDNVSHDISGVSLKSVTYQ